MDFGIKCLIILIVVILFVIVGFICHFIGVGDGINELKHYVLNAVNDKGEVKFLIDGKLYTFQLIDEEKERSIDK